MKKIDLINNVSKELEITKKDATMVIDCVIDNMKNAVIAGEKLELNGFLTIYKELKPEREAMNPKTGEKIKIQEKYYPKCKFMQSFKNTLN